MNNFNHLTLARVSNGQLLTLMQLSLLLLIMMMVGQLHSYCPPGSKPWLHDNLELLNEQQEPVNDKTIHPEWPHFMTGYKENLKQTNKLRGPYKMTKESMEATNINNRWWQRRQRLRVPKMRAISTEHHEQQTEMINKKKLCGVTAVLPQKRIVAGTNALKMEFPFMAALYNKYGKPFCGATILSRWVVVTAAHCVHGESNHFVRSGILNLNDFNSSKITNQHQIIKSTKAIIHEDYHQAHTNDLALIRLSEPLDFSTHYINRICLPNEKQLKQASIDRNTFTVIGWGRKELRTPWNISPKMSDHLQKAQMPVARYEDCKKNVPQYDPVDHICVGNLNWASVSEQSLCYGDSGGPLLLREEEKCDRWFLYGVASFIGNQLLRPDCSSSYSFFTNLAKHIDWIKEKMHKLDPEWTPD